MREASNEAALVVLHHVAIVVLEELVLEVGQVKAAVIVCGELVGDIEDDLVRVSARHEGVRHGSPNPEHLLVARDELVELKAGVGVDRQVADLVLGHVNVDALTVGETASGVNHSHHLVPIDLDGVLLLLLQQFLSVFVGLRGDGLRALDYLWLLDGVLLDVLVLHVNTGEEESTGFRSLISFDNLLLGGGIGIGIGSGRIGIGLLLGFGGVVDDLELVHLDIVALAIGGSSWLARRLLSHTILLLLLHLF